MSDTIYVLGGEQRAPRKLLNGEGGLVRVREGPAPARRSRDARRSRPRWSTSRRPGPAWPRTPRCCSSPRRRVDGVLYATTQTEVILFELPWLRQLQHISLPFFNDVHHVRPTPAGNAARRDLRPRHGASR